jgi:hypothetical protein
MYVSAVLGRQVKTTACITLFVTVKICFYVNFLAETFIILSRATKLGEFLPIGQLFKFDTFLKITEMDQILGLNFFMV